MFKRRLKILYAFLSLLTFCLLIFVFANAQRSKQQEIMTRHINDFQRWSYTFYSQDWVSLAIQTGATESIKKLSKDFLDTHMYAQNYYYDKEYINGFGSAPIPDIRSLKEGWQNMANSIVLKTSINGIDILTFRDNPRGYLVDKNNAKIPLNLEHFKRALPLSLICFFLFNLGFGILLYIQYLINLREAQKDKQHDFQKIMLDNSLLVEELKIAKDNPQKIQKIASELNSASILHEAALYNGDPDKTQSYEVRYLIDQFVEGFFNDRDKSCFKLDENFRKGLMIKVDRRIFYKVLTNAFSNAYAECYPKRKTFNLSLIEGTDNLTFIISNESSTEYKKLKRAIKKGISFRNSSGRGISIISSSLKKMKKKLCIYKSGNTINISFDAPLFFKDRPWTEGRYKA